MSASLQRPESDLDGSSYVPSLASPTTRDSLDEGYDPDETLKVIVYDNEDIKIKSSGIYYDSEDDNDEDEQDSDDKDVVYIEEPPSVDPVWQQQALRQSRDDEQDVVYLSSHGSRSDLEETSRADDNVNNNVVQQEVPVQLHDSYEDSQDVEIYKVKPDIIQLHSSYEDSQDVELYQVIQRKATIDDINEEDIDAFEQFETGDIVEIEPGKFCMVKADEEGGSQDKIELMSIKTAIDYGALDQSASFDDNVQVCRDILKNISFDEISLSSIKRLRAQNKKLRRMSNITSLDSDTKVFNEIWNAVKQDKFETSSQEFANYSLDSDTKVFNLLNKSLSSDSSTHQQPFRPSEQPIPEAESCPSSIGSWSLPENPGASPVYYPASQEPPPLPMDDQDLSPGKMSSHVSTASDKNISVLRERCSSRTDPCSCDVIFLVYTLASQITSSRALEN